MNLFMSGSWVLLALRRPDWVDNAPELSSTVFGWPQKGTFDKELAACTAVEALPRSVLVHGQYKARDEPLAFALERPFPFPDQVKSPRIPGITTISLAFSV
jgi:hypothetical protein